MIQMKMNSKKNDQVREHIRITIQNQWSKQYHAKNDIVTWIENYTNLFERTRKKINKKM